MWARPGRGPGGPPSSSVHPPHKDAQLAERRLLGGAEQAIAPVNGVVEGVMPSRHIPRFVRGQEGLPLQLASIAVGDRT
jgi:hypothetical protein